MTEISPSGGTATIEELHTVVLPAIPCEYFTGVQPNLKPCKNEAKWIMHVGPHCTSVKSKHQLLCDACLERIKSGDVWKCLKCGQFARVIEYVTKIERI